MKAKRQIESSLNSVTMLDGSGGQITIFGSVIMLTTQYYLLLTLWQLLAALRDGDYLTDTSAYVLFYHGMGPRVFVMLSFVVAPIAALLITLWGQREHLD